MAAADDKRHVWRVVTNKPSKEDGVKGETKIFHVSARMMNSALSKASKYMKDHGFDDHMIMTIESIVVIDY